MTQRQSTSAEAFTDEYGDRLGKISTLDLHELMQGM